MSESGFFTRKKVLLGVVVLAFLGFAWLTVSSWTMMEKDSMAPEAAAPVKGKAPAKPGAGGFDSMPAAPTRPAAPPVSVARKMVPENPGEEVDPRLANATVTEISAYDPQDDNLTPEEQRIKKTISVATKPLRSTMTELPSFRYKGKMNITVPTMAESEEAYKAGERYGKGIEVTSSFLIEKAQDGSYHVHQEAKTAKGDTKYDSPEYNGDLYYKDGEFVYVGADGKKADDKTLSRILAAQDVNKLEPLVRRNFIQILNEISMVVGFDQTGSAAGSTDFNIKPINPEKQESTVKLSGLSGQLSILDDTQTMQNLDIKGAGQLKSGYMSGANISYDIHMEVTDIGGISTIDVPSL
ncbi:MAG: hypothetical protein AB1921_08800 [Thermodesulfobacteriota bacterium]